MLSEYPDVLTVKQLQELLPLGRNSIYNLIRSGAIRHLRAEGKILIPKACLVEYLESASAPAADEIEI